MEGSLFGFPEQNFLGYLFGLPLQLLYLVTGKRQKFDKRALFRLRGFLCHPFHIQCFVHELPFQVEVHLNPIVLKCLCVFRASALQGLWNCRMHHIRSSKNASLPLF